MSLPFFYEPAISQSSAHFTLGEETSKHCIQVLRMKAGEQLQLTNGKGSLFTATIVNGDKKKTVVLPGQPKIIPPHGKKISIAISLLKNAGRFEWFLEKATEIGISEIQPLLCNRTEHSRFRHERMNAILIAAMLQSQQAWLPVLHEPIEFTKFIRQSPYQQKLIAHCVDGQKQFIKDLPIAGDTQILIGPEGDFNSEEIKLALDSHYLPVSLGETRLRAETAGVVAASLSVNR
ncbi:MAG: ribosomal small subunit methyltransferase [Sediminibacterium sp.]|nr:ribosomal small subunit methyltransferase [Sediminibacterium sp.]